MLDESSRLPKANSMTYKKKNQQRKQIETDTALRLLVVKQLLENDVTDSQRIRTQYGQNIYGTLLRTRIRYTESWDYRKGIRSLHTKQKVNKKPDHKSTNSIYLSVNCDTLSQHIPDPSARNEKTIPIGSGRISEGHLSHFRSLENGADGSQQAIFWSSA